MAEAKVIQLSGGTAEAKRAHRADPQCEARMRDGDQYPIWVSIRDAGHVRGLFKSIHEELGRAGFSCADDLQTEPHEGLKIESFFEIFLQVDQKRAPENLGMVTLFSDADGNMVIKMSPNYPEACNDFRSALSLALQRQLGAAGGGTISMDIVIRQQNSYEPMPPRPADDAPKPA